MTRIKRQRAASMKNLEQARKMLRSAVDSSISQAPTISDGPSTIGGEYDQEVFCALSHISSKNSGHSVNRSNLLICFITLEYVLGSLKLLKTLSDSFFNTVKPRRGNIDLLMYSLSKMAKIGSENPDLSLTKISVLAHQQLGFGDISLYSPQWLRFHFKRSQDFPQFYSGFTRGFPLHLGRTLQLTAAQEKEQFLSWITHAFIQFQIWENTLGSISK